MKKLMLSVLVLGAVLAMALPRPAFAQSNTDNQDSPDAAATEQANNSSSAEAGESNDTEDGEPAEGEEEEDVVEEEEEEPQPRIGTTWKRILISADFTITIIIRTGSGEETITIEEALPEQIIFEVVGQEIVDEEVVDEDVVAEEGATDEDAVGDAQADGNIQPEFRPDETVTQGVVPDQPIIVESSGPDIQ